MAVEDLKRKYGGKTQEAVNRAIRAEIDGGEWCMDAMHLTHKLAGRYAYGTPRHRDAQTALDALRRIAGAMDDEIRRRYDMPPRA